jgi:hypothetical protein
MKIEDRIFVVSFEISTAMTVKNTVFWDVRKCGCCRKDV